MFSAIKFVAITFAMVIAFGSTYAIESKISCTNPTGSKIFVIDNNKVRFEGRVPSSSIEVRTKRINNGLTHTMMFEGQKHIIHIEDVNNFNPANDYLWVISSEGHKFLHPVTCN